MATVRPIPKEAIDIVKQYEGLHLKAYICPAGLITIGWGHVLSFIPALRLRADNPELYFKLMRTEITLEQAEAYIRQDLRLAALAVLKLIRVELTEGQYAALISFVFNLGANKLQASTLRSKLNRGEYEDAAKEFPKWVYANGRKLSGLEKRRKHERYLFDGEVKHDLASLSLPPSWSL